MFVYVWFDSYEFVSRLLDFGEFVVWWMGSGQDMDSSFFLAQMWPFVVDWVQGTN